MENTRTGGKVTRVQFDVGEKTLAMLDEIVETQEAIGGRSEILRMLIREYHASMHARWNPFPSANYLLSADKDEEHSQ